VNGALWDGLILLVMSLAVDCLILKGLMRDVVNESCLALLLSEKGHLRCVVDGSGSLRSRFLGSHCGNGFSEHERWAPNVGTCRHVVKLIKKVGEWG
jgi:hypothetical protein